MKISTTANPLCVSSLTFSARKKPALLADPSTGFYPFSLFEQELGPQLAERLNAPNLVQKVKDGLEIGNRVIRDLWRECQRRIHHSGEEPPLNATTFFQNKNAPGHSLVESHVKPSQLALSNNAKDHIMPHLRHWGVLTKGSCTIQANSTNGSGLETLTLSSIDGNRSFQLIRRIAREKHSGNRQQPLWGVHTQELDFQNFDTGKAILFTTQHAIARNHRPLAPVFRLSTHFIDAKGNKILVLPTTKYKPGIPLESFFVPRPGEG